MSGAGLNDKQHRFVDEYLVDLNATQAAIRAGYSARTARAIGHENLTKPNIASAIAEAQRVRSARTEITQDRVLRELARIGFADIRRLFSPGGHLLPIDGLDDDTAACLSAVEVVTRPVVGGNEVEHVAKIKLWDKRAALVDIGKHLGMFKEIHELTGKNGGPIELEQIQNDADAFARAVAGLVARSGAGSAAGDTQH